MSQFFDDLEKQLQTAARARTDAREDPDDRPSRSSGWAWLLAGARAAPVLIAVVTTLVIAGAALVAFGHGRHRSATPSSSRPLHLQNPNLRREVYYLSKAMRTVVQTSACRPPAAHGTTYTSGSPGQDLLSTLGVLRRPVTSADSVNLRFVQGDSKVYRGYVRRALVADGVSYFIAATSESFIYLPATRCLDREVAALRRELPQIPPSLRAPTAKLQAQMVAGEKKLRAAAPLSTICYGAATHNASSQMCGVTATAIRHGLPPMDNRGIFSGIVPDGVASVTLHYKTTTGEASIAGPVTGNMYAIRGPQNFGSSPLVSVVWRSANGKVLKTVTQPSPAILVHYCKQHRGTCAALQNATVVRSMSSGMARLVTSVGVSTKPSAHR